MLNKGIIPIKSFYGNSSNNNNLNLKSNQHQFNEPKDILSVYPLPTLIPSSQGEYFYR